MHNHNKTSSGIYTIELKTKQAVTSNATKTSHSFNSLISRLILKNKKPYYTLKLKSIRCVVENDSDFRGEVNNVDLARARNFNIYLKGLDFLGYSTNELLLYTYSITLPKLTRYNLSFHRGDLKTGSGANNLWYYFMSANGYDNARFANKYVSVNPNPKDYIFRFRVISFSYQTIVGKTGTFSGMYTQNGSSPFFIFFDVLFDDGTSASLPFEHVNRPMIIQMMDWYDVSEPYNQNDNFNQEFTFRAPTDDMINLQLEYRDIETNQVLTSTETNNEALPDMDFHFEIS